MYWEFAMADQEPPKNFWQTLPGLLTGLAGLVTAIGGAYATWQKVKETETTQQPRAESPQTDLRLSSQQDPCAKELGDSRPITCLERK
jgi:hypothetical protein